MSGIRKFGKFMEDDYYKITDILIAEKLDEYVSQYGLEGTEDFLKGVFINYPDLKKIKNIYLEALHKRWRK